MEIVMIDGVEYVPKTQPEPNGNRAVVVVDRGWIWAGDVTEEDGWIYLDRAVWVFRWERIGFASMVDDPTQEGVDLRPLDKRVEIPAGCEIFRIPVGDSWGL